MALVALPEGATALDRSPRDQGGRYATVRNPLVLFEIVREVALVAARRDADPFKDPTAVAQTAWNGARRALAEQYGHIPQANEVCRQLCNRDGKPWPWRDLLALVFDESRDPKKTWEERLSEPERVFTHDHVYFALNFVDQQLGAQTQLRFVHEYEAARQQLFREARKRGTTVEALKRRLPTPGQIETACGGSWERALEVARLQAQPSAAGGSAKPTSIIEAAVRFYEGEGFLPTEVELTETARRHGIALERVEGQPWLGVIEEAQREANRRGLPQPPPYGTRPAGNKDAESPGSDRPATKGFYTHVHVLERVREFAAALPAATSATDKRWREFQRGRVGVPCLNVLRRHGGLRELLREASLPDWRERAEKWDAQAITAPRGRLGRPRSDRAERVEELVRERDEVSAREVAEALGYSVEAARYFLRQLKKAGRIEATHAFPQARNQRYRPTDGGENGQ